MSVVRLRERRLRKPSPFLKTDRTRSTRACSRTCAARWRSGGRSPL